MTSFVGIATVIRIEQVLEPKARDNFRTARVIFGESRMIFYNAGKVEVLVAPPTDGTNSHSLPPDDT
jgi:hypothetical protein